MGLNENPILDIQNLTMDYGKTSALQSVSMQILENKVTALVGGSGSGKSSFLSCLNQLFQAVACCHVRGRVLYRGEDVLNKKTNLIALRREIGMVFQSPNPFPLSVRKNMELPLLELGIYGKGEVSKIVESTLKKVGLWNEVKDRMDESALNLSGGQQQRLCIARAVALKPTVLLMDEPTSSLDPVSTKRIETLIMELKSEYTIVLVTHSLSQAKRVADEIGFFATKNGCGQLIEFGRVDEIFSAPKDPMTKEFITSELL